MFRGATSKLTCMSGLYRLPSGDVPRVKNAGPDPEFAGFGLDPDRDADPPDAEQVGVEAVRR